MLKAESLNTLIVDDDVLFRSFMRRCLKELEQIKVVGTAANGETALRQVELLHPDLVTLNLDMPGLHGLDVVRKLQLRAPQVRVIVVSAENGNTADQTMEALECGACDFILKPDVLDEESCKQLEQSLGVCVRVSRSIEAVLAGSMATVRKTVVQPVSAALFHPDIIAIGSSTGGPAALSAVISALPADMSVPIVIAQHMPALFVQSLASRLDRESALRCRVAEHDMRLEPGCVYIAPGEIHSEVIRSGMDLKIQLVDGPKLHHCKPAVDRLFMSLKDLAPGIKTLAVVLTGMGSDGALGARGIADAGGHVIAQNEASSTVWGMPGATVKTGAVAQVLPLEEIAAALMYHGSGKVFRAAG